MPLRVDGLTLQDRDWLSSQITADSTPDQIRELALRLLDRMLKDDSLVTQAKIEVQRLVNLLRQSEANQQVARESGYYQFGYKAPRWTIEHHVYKQFKVHERDFPAFCKHFGLSASQMLKVARGQIQSHKEWIQGRLPGNLGKRYTGDPRAFGISISGLRRGYQPVPNYDNALVFEPAQWWSPPAE